MANSIELIQKYSHETLDEIFQKGAVTSILERNQNLLKFINAKTVLLPSIEMDGLGDYSRSGGYPTGSVSVEWEPYTLEMDRGKEFIVDAMDDEETAGIAFGSLSNEFTRLHIIPEVDAYRLSTIFSKAEEDNITEGNLTENAVIKQFNKEIEGFENDEVGIDQVVGFISTELDRMLKDSTELQKKITQMDYQAPNGLTFKVRAYEGIPLIVVPKKRFKTSYVFNDGGAQEGFGFEPTPIEDVYTKTKDQAVVAGKTYYTVSNGVYTAVDQPTDAQIGNYYEKTISGAVDINYMFVHYRAALPVKKHAPTKVWTPEENQTHDAYKFQTRLYHGIFTPKNKTVGIRAHIKKAGV